MCPTYWLHIKKKKFHDFPFSFPNLFRVLCECPSTAHRVNVIARKQMNSHIIYQFFSTNYFSIISFIAFDFSFQTESLGH